MLCPVLLGECRGALQAEVCGGERCDDLAVDGLGCLRDQGGRVEDAPQDRLVVLDRGIGRRLVLVEESLQVFLSLSAGDASADGGGRETETGGQGLPQPYRGWPGWGPRTLWFLGEAGVAGLAAILGSFLCYSADRRRERCKWMGRSCAGSGSCFRLPRARWAFGRRKRRVQTI